jgi:glycolate dehydrogenase FAD-linked subunit
VFPLSAPLEPVPAALADRARAKLERALGPSKVLTEPDACAPYARDDSEARGVVPAAVVLASSAADVRLALEASFELGVPVTPRAGGSGRTGGAVPAAGGVVLDTRGLDRIVEIDRGDLVAVVGPGVVLDDLHRAVEAEGLFYPPDPNSSALCRLGGNVAENAGGPRAFKYGVTRDYVLGLEACLPDGRPLRCGKRTVKGVTGYDVTALLVGSEGTLGVFTEITLRLLPKPAHVATLLALFGHVRDAGRAVSATVAAGLVPRCLELLDRATLDAVRAQGVGVDPRAGAMLLIEVDGDPDACDVAAQRVGDACAAAGALDVLVAQDAAQRDRLWAARKGMSPAVRKLAKHKLSEDVVVPRSRVADLLDRAAQISEREGVRSLAYGHAGDGNLHVNFLWNDESEVPAVGRAIEALMRATIELRGTLSGEHGIGIAKAAYLGLEQSRELIALQERLKAAFDPRGLLNPGKIFWPESHRAC